MSKLYVLRAMLAIFIIFSLIGTVLASVTGKIAGVVTDKTTGEPLFGVNVILVGSYLGAATEEEGRYFIINVSPGVYELEARMMGYTELRKTIVRVRTDRTTTINFELEPTVIEAEEAIVVVAERELVRPDVSGSVVNITPKVIEDIPLSINVVQTLITQAGVKSDGKGIVIRRGDNREIAYFVDGVNMKQQLKDRPLSGISQTAIEDIQLLSGGFSAEYGDARSGIVNIVTKTPGKKYFFNFVGRYSPLWEGGLKHFGPYVYSRENWWEYGRYWNFDAIPLKEDGTQFSGNTPKGVFGDTGRGYYYDEEMTRPVDWINENGEDMDRNSDGRPDFEGWNNARSLEMSLYDDPSTKVQLSPEQMFKLWQWQHRSVDKEGNVYFDRKKTGLVDSSGLHTGRHLNYYAYAPDYNFDVSFGGPLIPGDPKLPVLGRLRFLLSHKSECTMYASYIPDPALKDKTTQFKLISEINPSMKLLLSYIYTDRRNSGGNSVRSMGGLSESNIYFKESNYGNSRVYSSIMGLKFTHVINPSLFYEVRTQYTSNTYRTLFAADHFNPSDEKYPLDVSLPGDTVRTIIAASYDPYDGFSMGGKDNLSLYLLSYERGPRRYWCYDRVFRFETDVTWQVNSNHQLKGGLSYNYSDVFNFSGRMEDPKFFMDKAYRDSVLTPQGQVWRANYAHVYPHLGALYLQDKMEYEGLVVNAGLRLDLYKPTTVWYDRSNPFIPQNLSEGDMDLFRYDYLWGREGWYTWNMYTDVPLTEAERAYYAVNYPESLIKADSHPATQVYLSPRIGVSHPIGPESKIYFNYGHFYQVPDHEYLYAFESRALNRSMGDWGNPWLKMYKTVQFEAGYEQRIQNNWVVNVSAYYKDIRGQGFRYESSDFGTLQIRFFPTESGRSGRAQNFTNRDIKGFEISLRKPYGKYITGFINSDYNIEKIQYIGWNAFGHPDRRSASGPSFASDPEHVGYTFIVNNPLEASVQYPADLRIKANLNFRTPSDFSWGPMVAGSKLLGNFSISIFHEWRIGEPFNYNEEEDPDLRYVFNKREKDYHCTDLNISKKLAFGKAGCELFFEVTNLFNYKNTYSQLIDNVLLSLPDESLAKEYRIRYMKEVERLGKRYGDQIREDWMFQRQYVLWNLKRDYWLGVRFYF